jgi:RNA polymerase sigma-70 factor, ECF subfamily
VIDLQITSEIIEGCRRRQPQAQEALYRACYPVFMKICLRYAGSYDDAANVLQEAFIKIFMKFDGFKGTGDIVGWMKRIVVNTAIDYVRKEKTLAHAPLQATKEIPDDVEINEPKYIIDENQLIQLVHELPKTQRLVFNLFVMENFSHQEIADQLSITIALSKWYLFDARKMLQKKLSAYKNG